MTADLTRTILQRAHHLDAVNLDLQAQRLGAADWQALTGGLEFAKTGTGGGCEMLTAALPEGRTLEITDGQAGLPTSAQVFWIGILDEVEEEEYSLHVAE